MTSVMVRELSRNEYAAFLETIPHSVFHGLPWLDAVTGVYSLHILLLGYIRGSQLCAVTPLMGRRVGPLTLWGAPLRKCGTPPSVPFSSPTEEGANVINAFGAWIRSQRLAYVQATVTDGFDPALAKADRVETLENLEMDLSAPLETIWRNLAQQKSSVRKAVRSGVRVRYRTSPQFLETQEDLVDATYGKQGIPANLPMALYCALLEGRKKTGIRVLSAEHQGKTVAAIWILHDQTKCYYWDAAALDESRKLNANHLLVWCLIRWAHRRGMRILDFVGAFSGGRAALRPGITRFKISMGAKPVTYRLLYWGRPSILRALDLYRLLQRARLDVHTRTRRRNPE